MTTKVEDIIAYLVTLERSITGVVEAYDKAPESLNALPAFINYPGPVEFTHSSFTGTDERYTIQSELFVSRALDRREAEAVCRPLINRFKAKVMNDSTLGGNVARVESVRADMRTADYAGTPMLFIAFETTCLVYSDPGDE